MGIEIVIPRCPENSFPRPTIGNILIPFAMFEVREKWQKVNDSIQISTVANQNPRPSARQPSLFVNRQSTDDQKMQPCSIESGLPFALPPCDSLQHEERALPVQQANW
jgi:hypothetical protein